MPKKKPAKKEDKKVDKKLIETLKRITENKNQEYHLK